jgi:hypothetical protein
VSSHLARIARALPLDTTQESKAQRVRRFLDNPRITQERPYRSAVQQALHGLHGQRVHLLIDRVLLRNTEGAQAGRPHPKIRSGKRGAGRDARRPDPPSGKAGVKRLTPAFPPGYNQQASHYDIVICRESQCCIELPAPC